MWQLCTLALAVASAQARSVFYHQQQVWSCPIADRAHGASLLALPRWERLDVWRMDQDVVEVRVRDAVEADLLVELFSGRCSVVVADVEALISRAEFERASRNSSADWHSDYHEFDEIYDWFDRLEDANQDIIRQSVVGVSYEGRDMRSVVLRGSDGPDERPTIYVQCQIHAREWISVATCMYVLETLVADYRAGSSPVKDVLDRVQVALVPFVNPDGYFFTWTDDRLWRKSRAPNEGSTCIGADLNRNWDDNFGGPGSSPDPCSTTYRGREAFDQAETAALSAYFRTLAPVHGAIDVHSYGQLILRPLTWTPEPAKDEAKLAEVGDGARDRADAVHGRRYTSGSWWNDLYASSGVAQDWFYNDDTTSTNEGVRAAGYTWELRPANAAGGGFVLPPAQIVPTGQEIYEAFKFFMESLVNGIPA